MPVAIREVHLSEQLRHFRLMLRPLCLSPGRSSLLDRPGRWNRIQVRMDRQALADVARPLVVAATDLVIHGSGWREMFADVAGSPVVLPAVLVHLDSGDSAGLVDS